MFGSVSGVAVDKNLSSASRWRQRTHQPIDCLLRPPAPHLSRLIRIDDRLDYCSTPGGAPGVRIHHRYRQGTASAVIAIDCQVRVELEQILEILEVFGLPCNRCRHQQTGAVGALFGNRQSFAFNLLEASAWSSPASSDQAGSDWIPASHSRSARPVEHPGAVAVAGWQYIDSNSI